VCKSTFDLVCDVIADIQEGGVKTITDRRRTRVSAGDMTRREVILSLSALAMMRPTLAAQSSGPVFNVRTLNHVTLTVADIKRSVDFYQRLFGMPLQSNQDDTHVKTHQGGIPCLGQSATFVWASSVSTPPAS
jgi:hypothetical protein